MMGTTLGIVRELPVAPSWRLVLGAAVTSMRCRIGCRGLCPFCPVSLQVFLRLRRCGGTGGCGTRHD